jgi:hypothetical protein
MPERLALALLLLVAAARAEDPAPAEKDPNVLLSLAFRKLQTAEHVVASVDVKHEPAEQPAIGGQGGAGGMIIMETRIAGQEDPFEGRVEAARAADGSVVLLSEAELPGFALYLGGERAVERTTFEEERFSLNQLRAELAALLDPKAFAHLRPQARAPSGRRDGRDHIHGQGGPGHRAGEREPDGVRAGPGARGARDARREA